MLPLISSIFFYSDIKKRMMLVLSLLLFLMCLLMIPHRNNFKVKKKVNHDKFNEYDISSHHKNFPGNFRKKKTEHGGKQTVSNVLCFQNDTSTAFIMKMLDGLWLVLWMHEL